MSHHSQPAGWAARSCRCPNYTPVTPDQIHWSKARLRLSGQAEICYVASFAACRLSSKVVPLSKLFSRYTLSNIRVPHESPYNLSSDCGYCESRLARSNTALSITHYKAQSKMADPSLDKRSSCGKTRGCWSSRLHRHTGGRFDIKTKIFNTSDHGTPFFWMRVWRMKR
jgi:hypothetical protein